MNSFKPRFENGIYRDCRWCGGKGCLSCPTEADKEYKRQFPDGPKPLMTLTVEEMDSATISAATGGPGLKESHGELGELLASLFDQVRETK